MKQFLPCSHVLSSWRSFTPVGQAHEWPRAFNRHKWLHPPLVLELHGLSPVISRQSSYLKMVKFQAFMNPWTSGYSSGLVIRRPRVQVLLWPRAGFVHGSREFKFLATLVKQPTGSPPTSWDFEPFYVSFKLFLSLSLKKHKGEKTIKVLLLLLPTFPYISAIEAKLWWGSSTLSSLRISNSSSDLEEWGRGGGGSTLTVRLYGGLNNKINSMYQWKMLLGRNPCGPTIFCIKLGTRSCILGCHKT